MCLVLELEQASVGPFRFTCCREIGNAPHLVGQGVAKHVEGPGLLGNRFDFCALVLRLPGRDGAGVRTPCEPRPRAWLRQE